MAKRRKNNARTSFSKRGNSSVMLSLLALVLVAVFLWYLVKRFARGSFGTSVAPAGGLLSDAEKSFGVEVVPQGITQVAGVHGFNNPGNITYNPQNEWYGQVGYNIRTISGKEYQYCNFESLYAGVRALYICVRNVYERMFGVDLSTPVLASDYLTFCDNMSPRVAEFYAEYSGTPEAGKSCESVFRSMVESVDSPLTALCMAVYRMEAGANYEVSVMDEISKFQYQRVF